MATTYSLTTTYAGEFKGKYISQALLGANSLAEGGFMIKPNIKYQEVIKRLETTSLLADGTCDFTATDTITVTERLLTPKELQVNLELCKKDHRADWEAIEMGFSVFDNVPPTFADYLVAFVVGKVQSAIETQIWSGTAGAGSINGIETLIAADANLPAAQEVAGTAVTAANVVAELGKIVDAIPNSLYGRDDLAIYVSQSIYRSYVRALGNAGFVDRFNNQALGDVMFDGVRIFVANGMTDDVAIATVRDNLWFGTSLQEDMSELRLLDMADNDGSQNVRIIMRFTAGVNYGIAEDIVTYGISNLAN